MNLDTHKKYSVSRSPVKNKVTALFKHRSAAGHKDGLLTLVIIPHEPDKTVKSIKFPKWILSIIIIFNIALLIAAYNFFVSYFSLNEMLNNKSQEYELLETVKDVDDQQINKYKANEQMLLEKLQTLKDLEDKLKSIIESNSEKAQSSTSSSFQLASRGLGGSFTVQHNPSTSFKFKNVGNLYNAADELVKNIENEIKELDDIKLKAENQLIAIKAKPSVLPVYGEITSVFGYREDPFGSGYEFHPAIDIAGSKGAPIRASGDGSIEFASRDSTGYGLLVKINHGNGYESLYGHNSKIIVKAGQKVKRGQIIAYMGSTGKSTGPHCHFEVRFKGKPVNPSKIK